MSPILLTMFAGSFEDYGRLFKTICCKVQIHNLIGLEFRHESHFNKKYLVCT